MEKQIKPLNDKVALITGGSQRIGACIIEYLHQQGANIVLHYRSSKKSAEALAVKLNAQRSDSVVLIQSDLATSTVDQFSKLVTTAESTWNRLDILINNASSFYPTPIGEITDLHWLDLMATNLKAPLFLSQAAAPLLAKNKGCIVNMIDVHAERPMKNHSVYCISKAGLAMLTKSLAKELGPDVRVNGVAPGAILWPENELDQDSKKQILDRTFLKRAGSPQDIAQTILFLVSNANYITGQIIAVDGGRSQNI